MRRSLLASALCVFFVAGTVVAGDVNAPPAPAPQPCTENCTTSATVSTANAIQLKIAEFIMRLLPR